MFNFFGARLLVPVFLFCLFVSIQLSCVSTAADQVKPLSGLKIVCVWSVAANTAADVDSAVGEAKMLGFNGVCWNRPESVAACRKHGIKSFVIVRPLDRRPEAQLQVLEPSEDTLAGFVPDSIPLEQFYQYGGETVPGHGEILDQNLACPNDPGVVGYTLEKTGEAVAAGYDGIVLDFVGYRNYHSCACPLCDRGLKAFRDAHPEMSGRESADRYFENVLVDLYDTLYVQLKALAPDLIVTNHIHPVFLPNLFYGHRISTDFCGITVSWFFKPHWAPEKVGEYLRKVVDGPYSHSFVQGMPMIGFYTDWPNVRDRKPPERVRLEIELLEQAGAQHLMFCELGHILRDREAYEVIRQMMGNTE